MQKTVAYIRESLQLAGYAVNDLPYQVGGQQVSNLEAILVGSDTAQEAVVVGAHYDSVAGTVGANDNATGVAATLELARLMKGSHLRKTVRFLFFVNEEPPYFQSEDMGSRVSYAQTEPNLRRQENTNRIRIRCLARLSRRSERLSKALGKLSATRK